MAGKPVRPWQLTAFELTAVFALLFIGWRLAPAAGPDRPLAYAAVGAAAARLIPYLLSPKRRTRRTSRRRPARTSRKA
jgi:hypothetical protein